jgi:hypothetical protein
MMHRPGYLLCLVAMLCTPSTWGHIVYGTQTLLGLVAEADLVVRARVIQVSAVAGFSGEKGALERPAVEAEVVEILKGSLDDSRFRFVQHGHGVATFEPGREHLLFLVHIARSRELETLSDRSGLRWVSLQEHDQAYPVDVPAREALLSAARAYAATEKIVGAEARLDLLRSGTLSLITSGDARLAASAIRDLVTAPNLALVTQDDRPALEGVIDDPTTAIGVRVALLTELEHRGLIDGQARWLALLADDAPSTDLVVVIPAVARDGRAPIRARLIALVASDRAEVAAAAAVALGVPGDASMVPILDSALAHPSSRVRNAAIRGLGATRTSEAVQALQQAGKTHPDPATRRLAQAEARKRDSQPLTP